MMKQIKKKLNVNQTAIMTLFDVNFPLATEIFFVSGKTDSRCAK